MVQSVNIYDEMKFGGRAPRNLYRLRGPDHQTDGNNVQFVFVKMVNKHVSRRRPLTSKVCDIMSESVMRLPFST